MSEPPEQHDAADSPLPCQLLVYRLLKSWSWVDRDNNQVAPAAFDLRPGETGVSVYRKDTCTLEEARAKLKKVKAVATLHVGRVRDLDALLDVKPDADDIQHAEITGIPIAPETEDDLSKCAHLKWVLAQHARMVPEA
jgi:hypothetical protein